MFAHRSFDRRPIRPSDSYDGIGGWHGRLYGDHCGHFTRDEQHCGHRHSWSIHFLVQPVLSRRISRTYIPICQRDLTYQHSCTGHWVKYRNSMAIQFPGLFPFSISSDLPLLTCSRSQKLHLLVSTQLDGATTLFTHALISSSFCPVSPIFFK